MMLRTLVARAAPARFARGLATKKFTAQHEWGSIDGKIATCGITDFAQGALGDVVYVGLPAVGTKVKQGESMASVESVKAASDVYAPVSGTVVEANGALGDNPALVNASAEGDAWFVKIEVSAPAEADKLMDAAAYKKHCEASKH